MKAFKVIKDPGAFRLLADETRRKIVYLLRVKEMNVNQLASDLNLTPQAVYHHVKKLLKGGLVEVAREERCCGGHMIESYYRATAEMFSMNYGKATAQSLRNKQLLKEQMTTALNALNKSGFNLEYDPEKISELVNAQVKLEEGGEDMNEVESKIYEMNDLDLLTKKTVVRFAKNLMMSEDEFSEEHEKRKRLRELLISLIKNRM